MSTRTFALSLGIALGAVVVGMAGAAAFNPDDGYVAHVDALWRVFGVGVYLGALATPIILLTGIVSLVVHVCGRFHARRA